MTVRLEILLLILACMAVTVLPRVLPLSLAHRIRLPQWFLAWLQYVPIAVISALFFREVLLLNGEWRQWHDPYLLAAWPTLAVAIVSRHILLTIIIGTLLFTLLRWIQAS